MKGSEVESAIFSGAAELGPEVELADSEVDSELANSEVDSVLCVGSFVVGEA